MRIKSKFTFYDKFKECLLRFTSCCKRRWATAERIRAQDGFFDSINQYLNFPKEEDRPQYNAKELALRLEVSGTGILEMDQNVLHPFVRVHIVDLNSNKYLALSNKDMPGIANKESCNFFRMDYDE